MPCRNVIKKYEENSTYHIYNRGVEKRLIFMDEIDRQVFCSYLLTAVNRYDISLLKFSLMPNHFHLLVKQHNPKDIERLMRSVGTKYSCYFNYKHLRVGSLFQGPYRARIIESDFDENIVKEYLENQ